MDNDIILYQIETAALLKKYVLLNRGERCDLFRVIGDKKGNDNEIALYKNLYTHLALNSTDSSIVFQSTDAKYNSLRKVFNFIKKTDFLIEWVNKFERQPYYRLSPNKKSYITNTNEQKEITLDKHKQYLCNVNLGCCGKTYTFFSPNSHKAYVITITHRGDIIYKKSCYSQTHKRGCAIPKHLFQKVSSTFKMLFEFGKELEDIKLC